MHLGRYTRLVLCWWLANIGQNQREHQYRLVCLMSSYLQMDTWIHVDHFLLDNQQKRSFVAVGSRHGEIVKVSEIVNISAFKV